MELYRQKKLIYTFLCAFFLSGKAFTNSADLIIFSYNRPLQLESLLRSIDCHIQHLENLFVLYRSEGDAFEYAYEELKEMYPQAIFYQQSNRPRNDFKPKLLDILNYAQADYIMFAVDDIIITNNIDIKKCINALKQTNAYGFYLRLGKNITYSYTYNMPLKLPHLIPITEDIYAFTFAGNKSYWAYPNTVDMTIYKKSDIIPFLTHANYSSPNKLESVWHQKANLHQQGLCFSHSKIINTPLNIVQEDWNNKHDDLYTPKELLSFWQQGLRIDISDIYNIDNNTAHISYQPIFINK
jgi:hypothetical protein